MILLAWPQSGVGYHRHPQELALSFPVVINSVDTVLERSLSAHRLLFDADVSDVVLRRTAQACHASSQGQAKMARSICPGKAHLEATDILAFFDFNTLSVKLGACGLRPVVAPSSRKMAMATALGMTGIVGFARLFKGVDLCFEVIAWWRHRPPCRNSCRQCAPPVFDLSLKGLLTSCTLGVLLLRHLLAEL